MEISTRRGTVILRRLEEQDSLEELTLLLHRAYSGLAELGLRYLATHQDAETTRERCSRGECYVGDHSGRLVATVTLSPPNLLNHGYYGRSGVAAFSQFGIDPEFQRCGLGTHVMMFLEQRARELGALELACDTAQPAHHLVRWYQQMGYAIVEEADWRPTTNYLSWIMSKRL